MAARWAATRVELGAVHRFRTPDGRPDTECADLTLRVRSGIDPATVFDDLHVGGHVTVWDTAAGALAHPPCRPPNATYVACPRCWRWTPTTPPPRSTRSSATGSSSPARSTTSRW